MSDWAEILIIRRFHRARRFAARKKLNFKLLTYHYIARATLLQNTAESFSAYMETYVYFETGPKNQVMGEPDATKKNGFDNRYFA